MQTFIFSKIKILKIEKSSLLYTCACVKGVKSGIFPDTDAVGCCKIRFKPIFSPVERIL